MADQLPTPNTDGIQWTKATSGNGATFEHGAKITENSTERKSEAATGDNVQGLMANSWGASKIPVNWPVGDQTWIRPSEYVPGLTHYRLYPNDSPIFYDYVLEFTNTQPLNFRFYDETEDSYVVQTFEIGDHYVKYSSAKPTIVFVKAEEPDGGF